MSDAVLQFLIANLALSGGILLVLLLRRPVRAQFGARLGYALWLLPLLAVGASFLPPRVVEIVAPPVAPVFEPMPAPVEPAVVAAPASALIAPASVVSPAVTVDPWAVGGLVWVAGMLVMMAWLAAVQMRFMAGVRRGEAGPAVVGFLRPRIVTPTDFEMRYDPGERRVILAHETIHLDRNDARINALAALIRCVCWFNPLVHLAAHVLRVDQEMACDAGVVERHPKSRKLYADALLKTQLAAHPLPLGCYWPAGTEHPLMERIEMLKQGRPGVARRAAGFAVVALIAVAAGCTTWAAKPAETRVVEAPAPQQSPASDQAPAPAAAGEPLRIVAIKRGLLEVKSAKGDKYVRRYFEPGESYQPRLGHGWTVTADDGSAFEWRLGDKPLGLLEPAGGPVESLSVDLVLLKPQEAVRLQKPTQVSSRPRPVVYEPQQAPQAIHAASDEFDSSDPIHLLGKVEKIDFGDRTYVAFVRATSIAACPQGPEMVNTALWELSPTPYWGDRDAVIKDLLNASVYVRGFNAKDKSCAPNCRMQARGVFKGMGPTGFSDPALTCSRAPQPTRFEPQPKPQAPPSAPVVHSEPSLFEIRADRGRYDEPSKTAIYEGDVEIRFDGGLFTTDRLVVEDSAAPARASSPVLRPRVSIGAPSPIKVKADRSDQDPQSGTVVYSGNVELRGADVLLKADRLTLVLGKVLTPISASEPQKPPTPEGQSAKKPGPGAGDEVKGSPKNRTEEEIIEKMKSELEGANLKRQAMKSKAEVVQAELKRHAMKDQIEPGKLRNADEIDRQRIATAEAKRLKDRTTALGQTQTEKASAEELERLDKERIAAAEAKRLKDRATTSKQAPSKSPEPTSPPATQSFPKPQPQPTSAPQKPPGPGIPFAKYFDADAPVMLKGRVTAIDTFEGHAMLRVEEIQTTTPGLFSFPKPDVTKMWRVVLGRLDTAPAWTRDPTLIGKVVEIRGYRGKEKDCGLDCMMSGRDVILSGQRLQGWAVPERSKPPRPQPKPI
jgi:beta-lactamase regulating signal transducer with metallopeptidase domain/lipopolysaccharide export system protein LptA